eukprot:TRINITY_DN5540_c0_g1_i1.p1 TRINITY_DN5540_c0_g1~~TRINITY_DN5540_c0_g1_i1.p1  ORF type:complete len:413 (-),score=41.02 TRINITY_DN5540_c0_g1_i1:130-1368(-)
MAKGKASLTRLPDRFQVIEWLGAGSGGSVWKALDLQHSSRIVAVKSIAKHRTDDSSAMQVLRELKVMRHLAGCEPIISLYDAFRCDVLRDGQPGSVCFVMEAMDTSLDAVIASGQVSEDNVTILTYQLLLGLKCIHQCGIIHRDLKPANLLVNADCTLKIADFGSARDNSGAETTYVTTRLYRAPELLLGVSYSDKVDIFAAGCIFGEMLKSIALNQTTKPAPQVVEWVGRAGPPVSFSLPPAVLFPAGNYAEQMRMILRLVGFPSDADLKYLNSAAAQAFLLQLKSSVLPGTPTFHKLFPDLPLEEVELLAWMLQLLPARRCSADEALQHRCLAEYASEFQIPSEIPPFDASYEDVESLKELLVLLEKELAVYVEIPSKETAPTVINACVPGDAVMVSRDGAARSSPPNPN